MNQKDTQLHPQPGPLKQLTDDQVKYLQDTLYKLIDQAVGRITYAESRRSAFVTIGGALFAASFAILAVTLPNIHFYPLRTALIAFSVSLMLVSFGIWFMYARQTNFRYPFTAVTHTWKWFYRDALPDRNAFSVPFHLKMSTEAFERGKRAFNDQWAQFETKQVDGLTDTRVSTYQDLQQMYVLHVDDYFKNLFLTHLRTALQVGIAVALGIFVLALGVGLAIRPTDASVRRTSTYTAPGMRLEAVWRKTGAGRVVGVDGKEVQLVVNLRFTNTQKAAMKIRSVIVKDVQRLRLPMVAESFTPTAPWIILPNSAPEIVGLVWISEPLADHLDQFEAQP